MKTYTIDTTLNDTSMLLLKELLNQMGTTVKHEQTIQLTIARLIVNTEKLRHTTMQLCLDNGLELTEAEKKCILKVECPSSAKPIAVSVQKRYDNLMGKLDKALMKPYRERIYPELYKDVK